MRPRLAAAAVTILLGLARAHSAHADASVTVTLNDEGMKLAQRLGVSVPDLIAQYTEKIDALYKVSNLDSLLRAFGNTASFAQRTIGVDYDVDDHDLMVGFAVAGVHGDVAIGTTNELLGGSILNYAAMAGANLGQWHHPRWTVFADAFYKTTEVRGLVGNLLTLGTHVQYQAIPRARPARARWTGVAVTAGIEYAHWTVGTSSSIESHFTAHGTSEDITIHMSATGTLDVLCETYTVPVEVSTGVRLARVLSLYAGTGAAVTTGDSTVTAQLNALLSYTGDHIPIGNAIITGSGEHPPSALEVHAFTGIEVHTHHVRGVIQGAIAPGELGVSLALRAVY